MGVKDNRYSEVKTIFVAALELEGDARESFVHDQCGDDDDLRAQVQDMLRQYDTRDDESLVAIDWAGQIADSSAETSSEGRLADARAALIGTEIGPYTLLEEIGVGGMGVVYRAEQHEPLHREVAIKLVRAGLSRDEVIMRFEVERQALAVMNHPNVARAYDAGTSPDGRPYFVMEYVPGTPITEYCDEHRLGIEARLRLFLDVCDGIQHAHQKGLIHRDIKPSNILVMSQDGKHIPKVIDFGVAKATQQGFTHHPLETQIGQLIGTPSYMSPEQIQEPADGLDTRSDIYSLGLVLYEMLTGAQAFDETELRSKSLPEMQRAICEKNPERPSARMATRASISADFSEVRSSTPTALVRRMRGDLDWIVMKALEKDPGRRYATASELAGDLERHLRHEPVTAGPPSVIYLMSKFARRNTAAVVAGLVLVGAILLAVAGVGVGYYRSVQAESLALLEAQRSQAVSQFLTNLLGSVTPDRAQGEEVTVREILEEASRRVDRDLADQALVEGVIQTTIGQTYMGLALLDEAEGHLLRSVEIHETELGPLHKDTIAARTSLASLRIDQGRLPEADTMLQEVYDASVETLGEEHEVTAKIMQRQGMLLLQMNRFPEAREMNRRALELCERVLPPDDDTILNVLSQMAVTEGYTGNWIEAVPLFEEVLRRETDKHGDLHPNVLTSMGNLAACYLGVERLDDAAAIMGDLETRAEKVFGPDHSNTLSFMHNHGILLARQRKFEEARDVLEECVARREAAIGPDHHNTIGSKMDLASMYRELEDLDRAEALFREVVTGFNATVGDEHANTMMAESLLCKVLRDRGELDEAGELLQGIFVRQMNKLGPRHFDVLASRSELAHILGLQGWDDEAFTERIATVAWAETNLPPWSRHLAEFRDTFARDLMKRERWHEAQRMLEAAYEGYCQERGVAPDSLLRAMINVYETTGQSDRALVLAAELDQP